MPVVLSDTEAVLFHALLMNAALDCHAMGSHEKQLRTIAERLMPGRDLPEPNRSSHSS